jgi:Short C-terminal domain
MFGNKKKLEAQLAQQDGTVAWATVIDAHKLLTTGGTVGLNNWGSGKKHVKVALRVEPDGQEPFEVTITQAFDGNPPGEGWRCQVIYDADDHSKIAIQEGSNVPPGLSQSQAEAAAAHRKARREARASGDPAAYMAEWKAKANRGEIPGVTRVGEQGAAPAMADTTDQLTKLADLRDRGVLTDAEFESQKSKLLAGT